MTREKLRYAFAVLSDRSCFRNSVCDLDSARPFPVVNLIQLGMFAMPIGAKLKCARGLNYGEVIAGTSDELQPNGKIVFREATGNG